MEPTIRRFSVILLSMAILTDSFHAQTVRESAETRFSGLDWTEAGNLAEARELPAKNVPGGNESFPVMVPANGSAPEAIYPAYGTIGILDYSTMDNGLIAVANAVADELKAGALEESSCAAARPWLASLTNFRLKELPKPDRVRFSAADNSDPEFPVVKYLASYGDSTIDKTYTLAFSQETDGWAVWEFRFGGD